MMESNKMEPHITVPLVIILTAVKILAQGSTPPVIPGMDASIVNIVGNLGIMGVLVWHLWYHTTKTYPNMQQKFADEMEKQRQSHLAEQSQMRAHCENEMSELRSMLIQNLTATRVAVHDVRDTVNSVVMKQAANDAAAKSGS